MVPCFMIKEQIFRCDVHLHCLIKEFTVYISCFQTGFFPNQNNRKDVDPSCETDLDPWNCLRKKKPILKLHYTRLVYGNFGRLTFSLLLEYNGTVKILKFGTPQTIAIMVLKTETFNVTLH